MQLIGRSYFHIGPLTKLWHNLKAVSLVKTGNPWVSCAFGNVLILNGFCADVVQFGHYDGCLYPSVQLAQSVQCAAVYMCIFVYLNIQLSWVSQCAEYCIVEEASISVWDFALHSILVCSGQYPSEYPSVQRPDRPDRSPPATTALCQRCTLLQCCQHCWSPLLLLLYRKTVLFDILPLAVHIAAMLVFHIISYCFYCKVIQYCTFWCSSATTILCQRCTLLLL